jgi:chemotaxis protein MotB
VADQDKRPIIIRRKVVKGGGHHGGAWKVAYADFVTAMMAFFLLMWLLNATTEEQRKGLADYFSPSIPVHRTSGGGDGPFGGVSVTSEKVMAQTATGASRDRPTPARAARGDTGQDDESPADPALDGLAEALVNAAGESAIADRLLQHVRLRRTEEGLVIDIMELPDAPLFFGPTAEPTPRMRELIAFLAPVLDLVTNRIAVDNHLDTPPLGRPGGVGWTLTSARALSVRELLAEARIAPSRFARVTGEADRTPAFDDPRDIRNRRTELILLNRQPG